MIKCKIDGDNVFAVSPANTLENIVVHSVVEGNATVSFGISPADPLYLLEPVEIVQGIYCELDFDLTYGEVIHDYIG